MSDYINAGTRRVSLVFGAIAFLCVTGLLALFGVPVPYAWGLIAGVAATLIAVLLLVLLVMNERRKLKEAQSRVKGEILCFVYAALRTCNLARRAYVFLCEDRIEIFLWDKRPFLETSISRDTVTVHYRKEEPGAMLLTFDDGDPIRLACGSLSELYDEMCRAGFRTAENMPEV